MVCWFSLIILRAAADVGPIVRRPTPPVRTQWLMGASASQLTCWCFVRQGKALNLKTPEASIGKSSPQQAQPRATFPVIRLRIGTYRHTQLHTESRMDDCAIQR